MVLSDQLDLLDLVHLSHLFDQEHQVYLQVEQKWRHLYKHINSGKL